MDKQLNHKSLIFVKCEQHSKNTHKPNLGSMVITWSVIGCWFSFSARSVTCDILSFETSHFIWTTKHVICDSPQEIPLYRTSREIAVFWKDFLEFLSWIKKHRIQTSHLIVLTLTFVLSSNQHGASQSVHWLGYKLEDMGFKSWQEHGNYSFSKTSRPAPATTQPPTQWKPQLFLWQ